MMIPHYFRPALGQADLTIACNDGVLFAHKSVLAEVLTSFHAAFFPFGTTTLGGPDQIGFNGSVAAGHLFLAEMYGSEIKVNSVAFY